jgi:predicted DNA binding CopG/RHH family protein
MKTILEADEKALLKSFEKGEWLTVADPEGNKARYRRYASATLKKDKRVNIRISEKDLYAIQMKALEEGIPYQTLMSSVLHKFVAGKA